MSVTIQQILSDSKRLASKLKEDDASADSLLSQAQFVYKKIGAMKQYTDSLSELNDMEEGGLPHEELVNSIRTESRQLQEIVRENRILRAMVAEHQTALEMIMSKYRSQVSHLVTQTKANSLTDLTARTIEEKNALIIKQEERIKEMMAVMSLACRLEAEEATKKEETIGRLQTENETLRKLLKISSDLSSTENDPNKMLASTQPKY